MNRIPHLVSCGCVMISILVVGGRDNTRMNRITYLVFCCCMLAVDMLGILVAGGRDSTNINRITDTRLPLPPRMTQRR